MPTRSDAPDTANAVDAARAWARARLARAMAELFGEPGGDDLLADPRVAGELKAAADTLGLGAAGVAAALSARRDAARLGDNYLRLFGHTVRSDCPAYELEYRDSEVFQMSQTLADLGGFYAAFGVELAAASRERPDHLVAEWEFLALLATREALATEGADAALRDCLRAAQRSFLRDHAAYWMPACFARVRRAAPGGPFAPAAELGAALIAAWCGEFAVTPGAAWLELRPIGEEDTSIECGAPGAAPVELGPRLAAAVE
ncbi:MAG: molecular chaperone TorD family protein [Phycisphaerae bacterium]